MALTIRPEDRLSIDAASERGVDALGREAEAGHPQVLLRDDRPMAAVVPIAQLERHQELQAAEEQLLNVTLLAARALTDSGRSHTLDEVLAHFGVTREELLAEAGEEGTVHRDTED